MANPQIDKGDFTRISNQVLEALCRIRIPGEARQVLDSIIRMTWGWNKTTMDISLDRFVLLTGLRKSSILKATKKLQNMNIIVTQKGNQNNTRYRFNKDFDSWVPLPKKEKSTVITQKGNANYPKRKRLLPKKEISITQKGNATDHKPAPANDPRTSKDIKDNIKTFFKDRKRKKIDWDNLGKNWS